jgi:hypothetical protein
VPVLQVAYSGLAEARRLLDQAGPQPDRHSRGRANPVPMAAVG